MIMKDFRGVSLREVGLWDVDDVGCGSTKAGEEAGPATQAVTRRLSIEACVDIALQLAEALHVIHSAHVVHKDINPDNIIARRAGEGICDKVEVQLIDFNLAEVVNETRGNAAAAPPDRKGLHGTLPYMSPEQTGRMMRTPDHRSDFYSLGMTLWELLIGETPFKCSDAMEYVHCHLAKEIDPVHTVDPKIPSILSSIISKAVEKAPESRYQSAQGLWADLDACAKRIAAYKAATGIPPDGIIPDGDMLGAFDGFEHVVGSKDFSRTIQLPAGKLYGRGDQQRMIFDAFERVKKEGSPSEIILLEGPYGSGKNSLVAASVMGIIGRGGRF
ncbi:hypothetical protein HK101_005846, partial [Irineochytrium annulatum]